jgi:UDP-glucose 4-epimerase
VFKTISLLSSAPDVANRYHRDAGWHSISNRLGISVAEQLLPRIAGGIMSRQLRSEIHAERTKTAAAVIGEHGFIGSHLSRALRLAGFPLMSTGPEGSSASLAVRTVYFVAGRVTPSSATQQPGQVVAEIESFRHLLMSVAREPHPPRVVLASSGGTMYASTNPPPYREDHPLGPDNAYGQMKLEMESMLRGQRGIEPVIVRLANVYGPGQQPRRGLGVVAHWMHALGHGEPITVQGHPDSTRDYIYVNDAVDLLVRIHQIAMVQPVLNAGSGTPTPLGELARLVLQAAGCADGQIRYGPARAVDRMHTWLDIDLARATLRWAPRTSLTEGLSQTWAKARPGRPRSIPAGKWWGDGGRLDSPAT